MQDLLALGMYGGRGHENLMLLVGALSGRGRSTGLDVYVVERATLLHADVREELTPASWSSLATTYLAAYEGTASKRWSELGIALDHLCVSEQVCKRVIEAARTAFHALVEMAELEWSGPCSVG